MDFGNLAFRLEPILSKCVFRNGGSLTRSRRGGIEGSSGSFRDIPAPGHTTMQLAKFRIEADGTIGFGVFEGNQVIPLGTESDESSGRMERLSDLLHSDDPMGTARSLAQTVDRRLAIDALRLLAPIDRQEVWGAGVTYLRSKQAREEESEQGGSFYDMVYQADRPELFFKATPSRVVGPEESIRVRRDSHWCVPEPELALVISPELRLVGFTVGNDVSARDIEGRNPLYLPQAKVYDACCALGPVVTLTESMPPIENIQIRLVIDRDGAPVFDGSTSLTRMVRRFDELIDWLGRDNLFPEGVILLTGTGIVPPDEFSLRANDLVKITIDGIGTLVNTVVHGLLRI